MWDELYAAASFKLHAVCVLHVSAWALGPAGWGPKVQSLQHGSTDADSLVSIVVGCRRLLLERRHAPVLSRSGTEATKRSLQDVRDGSQDARGWIAVRMSSFPPPSERGKLGGGNNFCESAVVRLFHLSCPLPPSQLISRNLQGSKLAPLCVVLSSRSAILIRDRAPSPRSVVNHA